MQSGDRVVIVGEWLSQDGVRAATPDSAALPIGGDPAPDLSERAATLRQVLAGEGDLDDLAADLAKHPWDSDQALVTMAAHHAGSVLRAYLAGASTADRVRRWADIIEVREDIEYEPGDHENLSGLIFELANPEITVPLSADSARRWLQRLGEN